MSSDLDVVALVILDPDAPRTAFNHVCFVEHHSSEVLNDLG